MALSGGATSCCGHRREGEKARRRRLRSPAGIVGRRAFGGGGASDPSAVFCNYLCIFLGGLSIVLMLMLVLVLVTLMVGGRLLSSAFLMLLLRPGTFRYRLDLLLNAGCWLLVAGCYVHQTPNKRRRRFDFWLSCGLLRLIVECH